MIDLLHSPTNNLLNTVDAAKFLYLRPNTLSAWRCNGRSSLKWIKIGSKVFYRQSDLDAFIEENTHSHANLYH
jgi:hypothetical protein